MDAVVAFAQELNRPVVCFDLEHTGGKKESRGITDFGAMVVTPKGQMLLHESLVKPAPDCVFEPFVSRLTGIWPSTVAKAPSWPEVMQSAVLPYAEALWVGFNSRSCDMPVIRAECLRYEVGFEPALHLDIMRLGVLKGSLSERVAQVAPDLDMSGKHRAAFDAKLTLLLLDAHLRRGEVGVTEVHLQNGGGPKKRTRAPSAQPEFLVAPGKKRGGAPWLAEEIQWLCANFEPTRTADSIRELAERLGRTPWAIQCALEKHNGLTRG